MGRRWGRRWGRKGRKGRERNKASERAKRLKKEAVRRGTVRSCVVGIGTILQQHADHFGVSSVSGIVQAALMRTERTISFKEKRKEARKKKRVEERSYFVSAFGSDPDFSKNLSMYK